MFFIESESIDSLLVRVNQEGRVDGVTFPTESLLASISTNLDIIDKAVGEIKIIIQDDRIEANVQGSIIYLSSDYRQNNVSRIWAGNNYLRDSISLSGSGLGFSTTGSSLHLENLGVSSIQGLSNNLSWLAEGNIKALTDQEHKAIGFSVGALDSSNINTNSELVVGKVTSREGIVLDSVYYPELVNLSLQSGILSVSGPSGTVIVSGTLQDVHADQISLGNYTLSDNHGELRVSGVEVSFGTGSLLYHAQGIYVETHTIENYELLDVNLGTYKGTIEHSLDLSPVMVHVDFSGSQLGFNRPYSQVLSYKQADYTAGLLSEKAEEVRDIINQLMLNSDNISNQSLTYFNEIVNGLDNNTFNLIAAEGEGFIRLSNAINLISEPNKTRYQLTLNILSESTKELLGELSDACFALIVTSTVYFDQFASLQQSQEGLSHNYYTGLTGLASDLISGALDATYETGAGLTRLIGAVSKLEEPKKTNYLNTIDVLSTGSQAYLASLSESRIELTELSGTVLSQMSLLSGNPYNLTNFFTDLLDKLEAKEISFSEVSDEGGRLLNALVGTSFYDFYASLPTQLDPSVITLSNSLENTADIAAYEEFTSYLEENRDNITNETLSIYNSLILDIYEDFLFTLETGLEDLEGTGVELLINYLTEKNLTSYITVVNSLTPLTRDLLGYFVDSKINLLEQNEGKVSYYNQSQTRANIDPDLVSDPGLKAIYLALLDDLNDGKVSLLNGIEDKFDRLLEAVNDYENADYIIFVDNFFENLQTVTQNTVFTFTDYIVDSVLATQETSGLKTDLDHNPDEITNTRLITYNNLIDSIKDKTISLGSYNGSGLNILYSALDDLEDEELANKYADLVASLTEETQGILSQLCTLKNSVANSINPELLSDSLATSISELRKYYITGAGLLNYAIPPSFSEEKFYDYLDAYSDLIDDIRDGTLNLNISGTGWSRLEASFTSLSAFSQYKYHSLGLVLSSDQKNAIGDLADAQQDYNENYSLYLTSISVLQQNPDNLKNSYTRLITDINQGDLSFLEIPGVGVDRVINAIISAFTIEKETEYLALLDRLSSSLQSGFAHYAEEQVILNTSVSIYEVQKALALTQLQANPDDLVDTYYSDFLVLVQTLLSPSFKVQDFEGSGLVKLSNAISGIDNVTKRNSLQKLLDDLELQELTQTLNLISDATEAQSLLNTYSDTLQLPSQRAYYIEFDKTSFSVFLKSPIATPPKATVRYLFGTSALWPSGAQLSTFEREVSWSGSVWGSYEYKITTYPTVDDSSDITPWITATVDGDNGLVTLSNLNLNSFVAGSTVYAYIRSKNRTNRYAFDSDTMGTLLIDGALGSSSWSGIKGSGINNDEYQLLASKVEPVGPISSWYWSSVVTGSETIYSFPADIFDGEDFIFYIRPANDAQNYVSTTGTRSIPIPTNVDFDVIYWTASWSGRSGATYEYKVSSSSTPGVSGWQEVTASSTSIEVELSLNYFAANSEVYFHVRVQDSDQVITEGPAYLPNLSLDTLNSFVEWDAFPWADNDYEISTSLTEGPGTWLPLGPLEGLGLEIDLTEFSYQDLIYVFIRSASEPDRFRYSSSEMEAVDPYNLTLNAGTKFVSFNGTKGATYTYFLSESSNPEDPSIASLQYIAGTSDIEFLIRDWVSFSVFQANASVYVHAKAPRSEASYITSTASTMPSVSIDTVSLEASWSSFLWVIDPVYQFSTVLRDDFVNFLYSPPPSTVWLYPTGALSTSVNLSEFSTGNDIVFLLRDENNSDNAAAFHYTTGTIVDLTPLNPLVDTLLRQVSWSGVSQAPYQYQVSSSSNFSTLLEIDWVGIRGIQDTVNLNEYSAGSAVYVHVRVSGLGYPVQTSPASYIPNAEIDFAFSEIIWDDFSPETDYSYQLVIGTEPTGSWVSTTGTSVTVNLSDLNGLSPVLLVAPEGNTENYIRSNPVYIPESPLSISINDTGVISWTPTPGVSGYDYQVVITPTNTPTPPVSTNWTSTSASSVNVSVGESAGSYATVFVRTSDPDVSGYRSSTVFVTTSAPSNLQLSMLGTGYAKMQATWTAIPGVLSYEYIYTESSTPASLSGWNSAGSTSYDVVFQEQYHRKNMYFHLRRSGSSNPFVTRYVYVPGAPAPDTATLIIRQSSDWPTTIDWIAGTELARSWSATPDVSSYKYVLSTSSTPPNTYDWGSESSFNSVSSIESLNNFISELGGTYLGDTAYFHVRPYRLSSFYDSIFIRLADTPSTSTNIQVPAIPSLNANLVNVGINNTSLVFTLVSGVAAYNYGVYYPNGSEFTNMVTTETTDGTTRTINFKQSSLHSIDLTVKIRILQFKGLPTHTDHFFGLSPNTTDAPYSTFTWSTQRFPDVSSVSLIYDDATSKFTASWTNPLPVAIGGFQAAITLSEDPADVLWFAGGWVNVSGTSLQITQPRPPSGGVANTWYAHVRIYQATSAYDRQFLFYSTFASDSYTLYPSGS